MFATNDFLDRHVKNAHSHKEVKDSNPAATAGTRDSRPRQQWSCNRCRAVLPSRSELLQHNLEQHQLKVNIVNKPVLVPQAAIRVFKCDPCQKVFASQAFLDQHVKYAHVSRPGAMVKITAPSGPAIDPAVANVRFFKCQKCPKYFIDQWSFDSHNKFEHPAHPELRTGNTMSLTKQPPNFKASSEQRLGFKSSSPANLPPTSQHLSPKKRKSESSPDVPGSKRGKPDSIKDQGGFECEICSKKFRHQGFYQKHMRVIHKMPDPDLDVEELTNSPRTLRSSPTVTISRAKTSSPPPAPQPRRPSHSTMKPNSSVAMNIMPRVKTEHTEPHRPFFKCLTCSKFFGNSDELSKHAQAEHRLMANPRPKQESALVMSCGFCFKNFPGRAEVVEHIRKDHQSGKLPVAVKSQPQPPQQKEQMLQDQQQVVKESKITCTICQKTCDNQQALDAHTMTNHCKGYVRNRSSIGPAFATQKMTKSSSAATPEPAKNKNIANGSMEAMDPLEILQRGLDELNQVLQQGRKGLTPVVQPQFGNNLPNAENPSSNQNRPAFPVKKNECIVIDL